jgi:hypothetical protein
MASGRIKKWAAIHRATLSLKSNRNSSRRYWAALRGGNLAHAWKGEVSIGVMLERNEPDEKNRETS